MPNLFLLRQIQIPTTTERTLGRQRLTCANLSRHLTPPSTGIEKLLPLLTATIFSTFLASAHVRPIHDLSTSSGSPLTRVEHSQLRSHQIRGRLHLYTLMLVPTSSGSGLTPADVLCLVVIRDPALIDVTSIRETECRLASWSRL